MHSCQLVSPAKGRERMDMDMDDDDEEDEDGFWLLAGSYRLCPRECSLISDH